MRSCGVESTESAGWCIAATASWYERTILRVGPSDKVGSMSLIERLERVQRAQRAAAEAEAAEASRRAPRRPMARRRDGAAPPTTAMPADANGRTPGRDRHDAVEHSAGNVGRPGGAELNGTASPTSTTASIDAPPVSPANGTSMARTGTPVMAPTTPPIVTAESPGVAIVPMPRSGRAIRLGHPAEPRTPAREALIHQVRPPPAGRGRRRLQGPARYQGRRRPEDHRTDGRPGRRGRRLRGHPRGARCASSTRWSTT